MENQEKLTEIHKLIHEKQSRFVYYITGLSVAAIAFSINKTADEKLVYSHVFVGIAILCWSFSILCGLSFLKMILEVLYFNRNGLDAVEAKQISTTYLERENEKYINTKDPIANKLFRWMLRLFYLGLTFFLVWHIIQMSKN